MTSLCTPPQRVTPGATYRPALKCKYTPGQRVIGKRTPVTHFGTFVRSYVTINNWNGIAEYHNVAYVVKCDDGVERSFQSICPR